MNSSFIAVNIGTGIGVGVIQLAAQIRGESQNHLNRIESPVGVPECRYGDARQSDLRSSLVSPKLAKQILGWSPSVQLSDGIRETVAWFAKSPAI